MTTHSPWGQGAGVVQYAVRAVALAVLAVACLAAAPAAHALVLPKDFQEDKVFSGLNQPMTLSFARDGKVVVGEKSGLIKVFSGTSDTTPDVVADLRAQVHDYWDRGFMSLVVHPDFPATDAVYVLYTYDAPLGRSAPTFGDACADPTGQGCVVSGRLSRLEGIAAGRTPTEHVMLQDWCQQYPSHSVGSLAFGNDGHLYVSGGDGASFGFVDSGQQGNPCGDPAGDGGALRSQDLQTSGDPVGLSGTVLRVDPMTGAGVAGNPLSSSSDANARRIIAYGLRNPFRMTFRPGTNELWLGDVGWNTWEEIDRITDPGGALENFGWPCYEGGPKGNVRQPGYDAADLAVCERLYAQEAATPGTVTAPFLSYRHDAEVTTSESCPLGGSSISGLAFQFYAGGPYPANYDGALFFSDYSRKCIWVVQRNGNQLPSVGTLKRFVGGAAGPVQLTMSPGGELFYVDLPGGTIRRIRYTPPPPNTEDKALGRPATASSVGGAGLEPDKAVDGSLTTRWSSAYSDGQWLQVDLGSVRQVDRVRVNWETAYAAEYRISTSVDGTTWSTAADVTTTQAGVELTSFAARGARHVRVTGVRRGTRWGISAWDLNVYGPSDTTNAPPVAVASATPTSGAAPLTVQLDGSGSSDPDAGDVLSYAWDLDGDGAHDDATGPTASTTYTAAGTYTPSLRVSDGRGGVATDEVTVGVGLPRPQIATPATTLRWAVGDTVAFSGSAQDNRGQPIPAAGLTWRVILHHGACPECHEHPVESFTGVESGSFRAPDHDFPSELELRLTATDANGLQGTTSVRLSPRTSRLTLATAPAGLQLALNGELLATPATRTVIVGSANTVSAPSPQGASTFASWSDGGAQSHTISAPATDTTLTATFTGGGTSPEDKAQGRPATASTSESSARAPGLAVDGDLTTRWASTRADGQWWQVDLGSVRSVDRVLAQWEAAYASRYRISTSTDGQTWTTAAEQTATGGGPRETTFLARAARYVRITALVRGTLWGVSLWEVDVTGPPDSAALPQDLARGRVTRASSTDAAGLEAARAVDGTAATRWASARTDGQWWQVDLGTAREVGRVVLDWEKAYASRYRISTSLDGTTWSTAAEQTIGEPGPRLTTFTGRSARYVRVTGLTRATTYGISFWEASVFGP